MEKNYGRDGSKGMTAVSTADGGCVISGQSEEAFTLKIDNNGKILWEKYYGGSGVQINKIIRCPDSGFIVCGRYEYQSAYILKINPFGLLQWQRIFKINGYKGFNSITEAKTNGYVLTGYELTQNDTSRTTVTRLDLEGNLIWENKYTKGGGSIQNISDGYIFGGSSSTIVATDKISLIKIDTSGNIFFEKVFDSTKHFSDINVLNSNRYVVSAGLDSQFSILGKVLITDSLGVIINQRIFSTNSFILFSSILSISNGDLIFSANADFLIPGSDAVGYVVRTDSTLFLKPVKIENTGILVEKYFQLHQNHPNPFNSNSKMKFEIQRKEHYKMKLYDNNGRLISVLIDKIIQPGIYEINLYNYFSNLSSSVYFISLENKDKVLTRKLLLLK